MEYGDKVEGVDFTARAFRLLRYVFDICTYVSIYHFKFRYENTFIFFYKKLFDYTFVRIFDIF